MGRLRRYRTLALILLGCLAAARADGQGLPPGFYDRPVLAVDPGRHTAPINRADVDGGIGPSSAGRFAVTASHDKTARVWSLATGALERTIRLPAGPGSVGKAFAVAIDPAGEVIAVGGYTAPGGEPQLIYLFARATGALLQPIGGLPEAVLHLAFSPDGRYLAATLGGRNGVRIFDRDRGWAELPRDGSYGAQSYGAAFAPDGRLATTSLDGMIRLYGRDFALPPRALRAPGGDRPFGVAFSRDGARLAVGYAESTRVDVLDGHSLVPLHAAAMEGIDNGNLHMVAWATNGTLLAGGTYQQRPGIFPVLTWAAEGRGARRTLPAGLNTVMSLRPLSGGDLLVAAQDPWLGRLAPDGTPRWTQPSLLADFRAQNKTLAISPDGTVVDLSFVRGGREPARFDLGSLTLTARTAADGRTAPPKQDGLPVDGWNNTFRPTLNGSLLPLDPYETSFSLALHPNGDRFVLGTAWALRAFDAKGNALWRQQTPGIVWAVNVTGDGRLAVAAYGDGTIRWHRMDDGREILAFMPFADRTNWVAWTPEGFYAASPGAHGVLRWVVNQPDWQPAKDYAVADIPGFYRPEAIKLVLREMETPRAIGLAVIAEQRRKVQTPHQQPGAARRQAARAGDRGQPLQRAAWRTPAPAVRPEGRAGRHRRARQHAGRALRRRQPAVSPGRGRHARHDPARPRHAGEGDDQPRRPRGGALLRPWRHGGWRAVSTAAGC